MKRERFGSEHVNMIIIEDGCFWHAAAMVLFRLVQICTELVQKSAKPVTNC